MVKASDVEIHTQCGEWGWRVQHKVGTCVVPNLCLYILVCIYFAPFFSFFLENLFFDAKKTKTNYNESL